MSALPNSTRVHRVAHDSSKPARDKHAIPQGEAEANLNDYTEEAKPVKPMPDGPTEKQIQAAVIEHWRQFGLPGSLVAAIPNAGAFGQPGLTRGLPDLLVVVPDSRIVRFVELKKDSKSWLSPDQIAIREIMRDAGISVFTTSGRDQPIRVLEELGVVRKRGEA
jgi:hypothetical protein